MFYYLLDWPPPVTLLSGPCATCPVPPLAIYLCDEFTKYPLLLLLFCIIPLPPPLLVLKLLDPLSYGEPFFCCPLLDEDVEADLKI